MANVRFLKPGEISKKNKKYIRVNTIKQIWQIVSFIQLLAIMYLLFVKH